MSETKDGTEKKADDLFVNDEDDLGALSSSESLPGPPTIRKISFADLFSCLKLGMRDFRAATIVDLCLASVFVGTGLLITAVTYWTGQVFWLVLAVLAFPMLGTLAAIGFYEVSRQRVLGATPALSDVARLIWLSRIGQVPWLAVTVVVIVLFWFFLGHMIFALFLGHSPITNASTTLDVVFTNQGAMMVVVGTTVGALFSGLVFGLTIHGMPMLIDRDVDFITAMLRSVSAVSQSLLLYLLWGVFIAVLTLVSILPCFLGLFLTMPILGHASWHLYKCLTEKALI